ncbi:MULTISPECIES: DUF92 domain-containing protein [Exiguobacterium]|uniref:DUF92 domain-containing protein n=1 Tax=Exiguobacterium sp. (strain ATCC BAA-1283 / AT1b) TaxID=360911 RepID=C4L3I9_EXISA|nr:DUF92 domain-containing protein [Exiguobacterium sp. AT1b]ACQ69487.1 protein of unknown function DUF92 transmembrane [Exiguobacterium sp. AT1b]
MFAIFAVTCFVAYLGYRLRSLTRSGALLTVVTGTVIGFSFGWFGLYLLGVFFSTSSLASKYRSHDKKGVDEIVEKTGARDAMQVLANGGVGILCALGYQLTNDPVYLYMYVVSIAAATSDTWGSEFGVLSKQKPRFMFTFKRVEPGTSGAVSTFGTVMSMFGALLIVISSLVFIDLKVTHLLLLWVIGLTGSIIDTLLGATFQRTFRCTVCGKLTEQKIHHDVPTTYVSGWHFLGNDAVNFLSVCGATLICFLVFG